MSKILWLKEKESDVQFQTTVFICQLNNVLTLRGDKKRLKRESPILFRFHFLNFLWFYGHTFLRIFHLLNLEC